MESLKSKEAPNSLAERKSRLVFITKLSRKGAIETRDAVIRRLKYLPKGTDFSKITEKQVARIEWLINNRPRKCLGFKTPYEIASSHGVALRG